MKVAPKTYTSGILNGYLLIILISHIIHGIGIFTHMNGLFLMVNVGKYTNRPMDGFLGSYFRSRYAKLMQTP